MKKIPLTQGRFAIVDDEDYEWISKLHWHFNDGYAVRGAYTRVVKTKSGKIKGFQKTEIMHRVIAKTPKGMETDHINGDGLDNRKENLRVCRHSQNGKNIINTKRRGVKPKGVFRVPDGKFIARIRSQYRLINLGTFRTEQEASNAYDVAALKLHGEFAATNKRINGGCY